MIRDDFDGAGGWLVALDMLGRHDAIGVEWDAAAVATSRAAGHMVLHADVRAIPTDWWDLDGYVASPPCQTWSTAGKGAGRAALVHVLLAAALVAGGMDPAEAVASVHDDGLDERTVLVLEPLRVIRDTLPTWVALEQVPSVLKVWDAFAVHLREWGYHVATGIVSAERYGAPQVRKRAVLVAHRQRAVHLPVPTHSAYYPHDPDRLDPGVLPWVSMGTALQSAMDRSYAGLSVRSNYGTGGDSEARGMRTSDQPSATVTTKVGRNLWVPTFNDQSGTPFDHEWPWKRPSTTVAGRGLVNPGATANRFNGSTKSRNDGVRVSVREAAALQTFPPDYPWPAGSSDAYTQVGNAVPPLMAAAILAPLITPEEP